MRKIFFTQRMAKHWNRLCNEVEELPSQKVLKKAVDVVLQDIF